MGAARSSPAPKLSTHGHMPWWLSIDDSRGLQLHGAASGGLFVADGRSYEQLAKVKLVVAAAR
eukprot:SAG31_NODE_866_length_11370_cov_4.806761_10_plen_63_part_00